MSSPKLELTTAARSDLAGIFQYSVEQWGVEQADRYRTRLYAACGNLASFPDLGRRRREYGSRVRSFPVAQHIVYDRVIEDGVEVVRITHALSRVESLD